jgi:hypothetical protein
MQRTVYVVSTERNESLSHLFIYLFICGLFNDAGVEWYDDYEMERMRNEAVVA